MLALFKGELSYDDIMNKIVFKHLIELRSARVQRLIDEQKSEEERRSEMRKEQIRNQILSTQEN